jgi:hypothetical protein
MPTLRPVCCNVPLPMTASVSRLSRKTATPVYVQDDDMLEGRTMGKFITLPTGQLFVVNGGLNGRTGFNSSTIPRLYHSSAILLPDASVLIAGSNPNIYGNGNSSTVFPTTYQPIKRRFSIHPTSRPRCNVRHITYHTMTTSNGATTTSDGATTTSDGATTTSDGATTTSDGVTMRYVLFLLNNIIYD